MKWYSINSNGNYKEYVSFKHAVDAKGILVVIERESTYQSSAGYTNPAYEYSFCQNGEETRSATVGKCQIISIQTTIPMYVYEKSTIDAVFADKDGVKIEPRESFGKRIEGVSNAIKFLLKFDTYENYENYCLATQIQELQDRVSVLENRLAELIEND